MAMVTLTTEQFVEKAKIIYNRNEFDYSLVNYQGCSHPIIIICPLHGEFVINPINFLRKDKNCGCPMCVSEIRNRKTSVGTDNFIKRAKEIHGDDTYDYSLVDYKNSLTTVKIGCSIHGIFEINARQHIKKDRNSGCPKCNGWYRTVEEIIEMFENRHGKDNYDYSEMGYVNTTSKLKIRCKKHNFVFYQTLSGHLRSGCKKCAHEKMTKDQETFIREAKTIHSDKHYNYSLVEYVGWNVKVKVICEEHGIFKITPNSLLRGSSCGKCNTSLGENRIRKFLEENKIVFEEQKKFDECKHKRRLPFDFYLPDCNIAIEYDGEQHFKPHSFSSGSTTEIRKQNLLLLQQHDAIKTAYCQANNIRLIRIPYWRKDFIVSDLTDALGIVS
jgi:hypothetical protein